MEQWFATDGDDTSKIDKVQISQIQEKGVEEMESYEAITLCYQLLS